MAQYRYRMSSVRMDDYGDTSAAGQQWVGRLAVIPDGSHWQDRPATIDITVEPGTRPGAVFVITIERERSQE